MLRTKIRTFIYDEISSLPCFIFRFVCGPPILNLVAKATPFTPMTECAAHVAHGAKYKASDVKITEIQEVKKNR